MAQLLPIIAALSPVFALVALGAVLGRVRFPGEAFWPLAERLTYYLLFPVLLVLKISTASLPAQGMERVALLLLAALLLMAVVALLCGRMLGLTLAPLSSLFQGSIRFNTYVGLAAAAELFGENGIVWGALFLAVMIPLVNVACVLLFVLGGRSPGLGLRRLLLPLCQNPLILACILGGLLNLTGLGMPSPLVPVLELLSRMALPLGLLAVGVGLDWRVLRSGGRLLWVVSVLKLLLYPLVWTSLGALFGVPSDALGVLLVFCALPTAPSAYILARQMGGDAPLMAAIITLQTLLAAATLPLVLALSGSL